MCKGSQTTTTQSSASSQPNPQAMQAYQYLLNNTQSLAQQPYNPYTPGQQATTAANTGDLVAPINAEQYSGIGMINNAALQAQPYYGLAGGMIESAAQPLTPGQEMTYYNPFQQNVVATTQEQMNLQNQMALNNIRGNAAAQGALGGDREGVAEAAYYGAVLPGQEQTIAGLEQQGFTQALGTAGQQFQQNPEAAAYALGNVGTGAETAALTGANAVFGAGTAEQQTQQNYLNALYQQYLAAQGYPFQLNQYAAGIETGVGSQMGGTESGTSQTTAPPPSIFSELAGLGTFGLGASSLYKTAQGARGGRINGLRKAYQSGGSPLAYQGLGGSANYQLFGGGYGAPSTPYSGGQGFVPAMGITRGAGVGGTPQLRLPTPPQSPQQPQSSANNMLQQAQSMAGIFKGSGSGAGTASASADPASWTASGADLGTIGPGVGAADAGAAAADAGAAAADVGVDVAAADVGASSAADLLPLLLLAKRGGRIQRQMGGMTQMPGGLQLPNRNRIQLPMRAGLGMPSFVPQRRGLQSGGSPDDEGGVTYIPETFATRSNAEAVADAARQQQLDVQAYNLMPPGASYDANLPDDWPSPTDTPQNRAALGMAPAGTEQVVAYETGYRPGVGGPATNLPPEITAGRSVVPTAGTPAAGLRAAAFDQEQPTPGLQPPSAQTQPTYQPPPRLPPSTRPTILPQQSSGKGLFGLSPEASYALMAAGLGMMQAGARPGAKAAPLGAIGEGGLQGLQTYAGLKKGEVDIEMESRKLDQQAQQEADRIKNETQRLGIEQERETREARTPHLLGENVIYSAEGYPIRSTHVYGYWDSAKRTFVDPGGNPIDVSKLNNPSPDVQQAPGPKPYPATPPRPAPPTSTLPPGTIGPWPSTIVGGYQGGGTVGDDDVWSKGTGVSFGQQEASAPPTMTPPPVSADIGTTDNEGPTADRPFRGVPANDATEQDARKRNLHGQAYLDAVPDKWRNQIESVMNYDSSLSDFATSARFNPMTGRQLGRNEALAMVKQGNPAYKENYYPVIQKAYQAFFIPGSAQSPAQQSLRYNTAAGHAGELADALYTLQQKMPDVMNAARSSGVPFATYFARRGIEAAAPGTGSDVAQALNVVKTIEPLFEKEATTFYSPTGGTAGERGDVGAPYNPALSFPEQISALRAAARMFKSKTDPLEQDYKDAVTGPGVAQYGTHADVKQWVNTKEHAQRALDRIEQLYQVSHPADAMEWVRQHPMDPKAAVIKKALGMQ